MSEISADLCRPSPLAARVTGSRAEFQKVRGNSSAGGAGAKSLTLEQRCYELSSAGWAREVKNHTFPVGLNGDREEKKSAALALRIHSADDPRERLARRLEPQPKAFRRKSSSGRIRLFVNGENLTGARQTRWDPLLLPTRAVDGRWTVDAWAPLDGRNINGGLRVRF